MRDGRPFGELDIHGERGVALGELSELIEELSQDFVTVHITRRNFRVLDSAVEPEVALLLFVSTPAASFLTELGKDLYRGVRQQFFRLYDRSSIQVAANARVWPMAFRVTLDDPESVTIVYVLEEGLTLSDFEAAISSILESTRRLALELTSKSEWTHQPVAKYNLAKRRWELRT